MAKVEARKTVELTLTLNDSEVRALRYALDTAWDNCPEYRESDIDALRQAIDQEVND